MSATNQHGVHSPFIYNYVTNCLYSKSKHSQQKSLNILLKSIVYFGAERIWLPPERDVIKREIRRKFPGVQFSNGPYDILFTNPSEAQKLVGTIYNDQIIKNDSLLLIEDIHENKANLGLWEIVKNHQQVTVTVDMFYCGAVFFRKEQAKEHFKIRI